MTMQILETLRTAFGRRKAVAQNNLGEMVRAVADDEPVDETRLAEMLSAAGLTFHDFEAAVERAIERDAAEDQLREADELERAMPDAMKLAEERRSHAARIREKSERDITESQSALSAAVNEIGRIQSEMTRLRGVANATLAEPEMTFA